MLYRPGRCCIEPRQLVAQILWEPAPPSCSHPPGKQSYSWGQHHKAPHLGPTQESQNSRKLPGGSPAPAHSSCCFAAPSPVTGADYGGNDLLPLVSHLPFILPRPPTPNARGAPGEHRTARPSQAGSQGKLPEERGV